MDVIHLTSFGPGTPSGQVAPTDKFIESSYRKSQVVIHRILALIPVHKLGF